MEHVLDRAYRGQAGHGRPARRLDLVLGDHRQQVAALYPHPQGDGPLRAGFLVRLFARRALPRRSPSARRPPWRPLFVAAMREWKRSFQQATPRFMGLQAAHREGSRRVASPARSSGSNSNLLVLATVASAGPFVGLFGTVWGIMTSFRSIAASKNTSLAVVAPGIAEALFATAIGLFAAIPALIAYNKLQGEVAKHAGAHGELRRRVLGDPVAPDRPACGRRARPHGGGVGHGDGRGGGNRPKGRAAPARRAALRRRWPKST